MGPASGREDSAVIQRLLREPFRFDFFQAVRVLQGVDAPARQPVGHDAMPTDEAVRFRALASLSFPASSIHDVQIGTPALRAGSNGEADVHRQTANGHNGQQPEMTVAFMGLTGPSGVLPVHYTKMIIERMREKDHSLRDFFDLFNHRLISLFYRAWEKYRLPAAYESAVGPGSDSFTEVLLALAGMGTPGLIGRMSVPDETFASFSGLFSDRRRSAVGLQQILSDYFQMPITVEQFQGQWLNVDAGDCTSMPTRSNGGTRCNNQLGVTTVLGDRVWDVQSRFRMRLGPLTYQQYTSFTPAGHAFGPLCELVRAFVGGRAEFDFDVQPVLLGKQIPLCQLGGGAGAVGGEPKPRLGWNVWLKSRESEADFTGAVFWSEAAAALRGSEGAPASN